MIALSAVAVAGVLLIAGVPAAASFTATRTGAALGIVSGGLTASVSGATVGATSMGSAPSGVVMRPGTAGIVPGIQAQTLSYTISNGGTARATARPSVRVLSTAVADSAAWAAIQPYLTVTARIGAGAATNLATTSAGIDQTVSSTTSIAGGGTTTLLLTFSLPATSGTTDLLRSLQTSSSGSTSIRSILTLQPQVTLTQSPQAGP